MRTSPRALVGLATAVLVSLAPCSVRPSVAEVPGAAARSDDSSTTNAGTGAGSVGGRVIDRVDVDEPLVALTFDDGPREPYTSAILDILADAGVPATFFLIGENVRRHPDVARRIAREGHAIGNHTLTHRSLAELSDSEIIGEVRAGAAAILAATGERTWLLRPPYGAIPGLLTGPGGLAARLGHEIVMWSVEVRDWRAGSALRVALPTLQRVRPGSVVLLHDGGGNRSSTVTATRWVVGHLSKRGYRLVTVPDLLARAADRRSIP